MEKRLIRVGSRDSKLAIIQSRLVMGRVGINHPELDMELVTMKTTGDIILDRTLDKVGGKGLFVKELDKALMDGRTDMSVHSLKDMPMEVPEELPLVAYSLREDPRDCLVLPRGVDHLDPSKPLGCSSMRRTLQLKKLFPDMEVKSVRGNVITRLSKLDKGEYSALILASAGIKRLGLHDRISRYFSPEEIIPAAGQGIIAVQGRAGTDYSFLSCVDNAESRAAALAERAFVRTLDGGCSSPIAAHAVIDGDHLTLTGLYYDEATERCIIDTAAGAVADAEEIGKALAVELKGRA